MSSTGPGTIPEGYVSSAEACARLNISDRTLRRRVKAGTIEGEYIARPQGSILYVKLPPDAAEQAAGHGEAASDQEVDTDGSTRQDAALLALIAEMAAIRQQHAAERAGDQTTIREQAEQIGALRADLAARDAQFREQADEIAKVPGWLRKLLGMR